jgi:hypothetical protein
VRHTRPGTNAPKNEPIPGSFGFFSVPGGECLQEDGGNLRPLTSNWSPAKRTIDAADLMAGCIPALDRFLSSAVKDQRTPFAVSIRVTPWEFIDQPLPDSTATDASYHWGKPSLGVALRGILVVSSDRPIKPGGLDPAMPMCWRVAWVVDLSTCSTKLASCQKTRVNY